MERNVEYAIIGAGPAGLQMAYFLAQRGKSYVLLERSERAGHFFERFPRHRKLISINKLHTGYEDPEINLRWDWNSLLSADRAPAFKDFCHEYFPAAGQMVEYLRDFAAVHRIEVRFRETVAKIERDGAFKIETAAGHRYTSHVVIIASGLCLEYIPEIPGIELAETYGKVSVDPRDFVNQRVLIIGKGNSAFETADNLVSSAAVIHLASPWPLQMAWSTHFVGDLRAVNNNLLDTYQLKSQNAILDAAVESIARRGERFQVSVRYLHAEGEREELEYDRVICCTGFRFDDSMFAPSCRPDMAMECRLPAMSECWESTNVPDLYFIGTLMQMRDYKKQMSGFIHGFRYNIRTLNRLLAQRYDGVAYPCQEGPASPEYVGRAILDRVNRSSGLWQQPGFLFDLISVDLAGNVSAYFEELPKEYILNQRLSPGMDHFLVSLEYGKAGDRDVFNLARVARDNRRRAAESVFLHPIIRHYRGTEPAGEHHIIEDLAAQWCEPEHVEPLTAFLAERLAVAAQDIHRKAQEAR